MRSCRDVIMSLCLDFEDGDQSRLVVSNMESRRRQMRCDVTTQRCGTCIQVNQSPEVPRPYELPLTATTLAVLLGTYA